MLAEDFINLTDREKAKANDFPIWKAVQKLRPQFREAGYKVDGSNFRLPDSVIRFENQKTRKVDGMIKVFHYEDTDRHMVESWLYDQAGKKVDVENLHFHRNSQLPYDKALPFVKLFLEKLTSRNPKTEDEQKEDC